MVEFVMPTAEQLTTQLRSRRRDMIAYLDKEGWNDGAKNLLKRLDRMIAKFAY